MRTIERRRFQRWELNLPCQFEWDHKLIKGRIRNLSYGGLCITGVTTVPPDGEDIVVTVTLGSAYNCRLPARVVHTHNQEGSFGVEFYVPAFEEVERLLEASRNDRVN